MLTGALIGVEHLVRLIERRPSGLASTDCLLESDRRASPIETAPDTFRGEPADGVMPRVPELLRTSPAAGGRSDQRLVGGERRAVAVWKIGEIVVGDAVVGVGGDRPDRLVHALSLHCGGDTLTVWDVTRVVEAATHDPGRVGEVVGEPQELRHRHVDPYDRHRHTPAAVGGLGRRRCPTMMAVQHVTVA